MAPTDRRAEPVVRPGGAATMFLVGHHVAHSLSPAMWNHLSEVLDLGVRYELRDVDEDGLAAVRAELTAGGVVAANVTMPHKGWAAAQAEVVTAEVRGTGAANFLQPGPDGLFADNTDVSGARSVFRSGAPAGRAVLLGAGGTASALLLALSGWAEHVTVVNRSPSRAADLVARHAERFPLLDTVSWDERRQAVEVADLVVNTVPMVDDAPVLLAWAPSEVRLYDAIYRRTPTALQREAASAGVAMCDGLTHLAAQAVAMLGHLGIDAVHGRLLVEGLEAATGREVTAWGEPMAGGQGVRPTVWLVGMMGSGKTTIGRRLAARLGLDFHDTDEVVSTEAGRSIPDLWETAGEDGFRDLEEAAIRRLAGAHAVVATGGGVVLRPRNVEVMRQSGVVIWLDAPVEQLAQRVGSGAGRPLLAGSDPAERLARVLAERAGRYRAAADRVVDAGRSPGRIVEEIEAWIGS